MPRHEVSDNLRYAGGNAAIASPDSRNEFLDLPCDKSLKNLFILTASREFHRMKDEYDKFMLTKSGGTLRQGLEREDDARMTNCYEIYDYY
jgi:hypothetical protein